MSRRALAEMVNIDPRYLANVENSGSLPSPPVFYQLVKICKLPVERSFFPAYSGQNDKERERTALKLELCPEADIPNELKRQFDAQKQFGVVVSDLTFVRVNHKWN